MNYNLQYNRGFGLVEILVASAVISASLIALTAVALLSFRVIDGSVRETQAEFLTEEGLEVVRILRDISWSANIAPLTSGVAHYPTFNASGGTWTLVSTGADLIDGLFSRSIVFDDVYRKNIDDDIVASTSPEANTLDPGTKQVTSRVTWDNGEREIEFVTYITNLFQN